MTQSHLSSGPYRAQLPLVSVLFITYKRADLLAKSVEALRLNTDYPRLEFIISDDGSPEPVQAQMRAVPADKHLLAAKNKGLGANINKGMVACTGDFILMVQDDWICEGPMDYLQRTVRLLLEHADIGIVNFTMTLQEGCGDPIEGSSAVLFPNDKAKRDYPYLYSDQPHIRRKQVNELIGPYLEDRDMVKCEQDYERRWDAQDTYRTAMFPEYTLSAFTNYGVDRSLRESRLQNRMDRALMPVAKNLKPYPFFFQTGKLAVRALQWVLQGFHGPR